jgi:hypothetical protein
LITLEEFLRRSISSTVSRKIDFRTGEEWDLEMSRDVAGKATQHSAWESDKEFRTQKISRQEFAFRRAKALKK